MEWVFRTLNKLGMRDTLIDKYKRVAITNHKGLLPCDLISIYPGGVREATDNAQTHFHNNSAYVNKEDIDKRDKNQRVLPNIGGPVDICNDRTVFDEPYGYKLEKPYIITTFKEGTVVLAYMALPFDDEGYPLIPENERILDAITAQIVFMRARREKGNYNEETMMLASIANRAVARARSTITFDETMRLASWNRSLPMAFASSYYTT